MNHNLIKKIKSIDECLKIVVHHHKNNSHIDESTLERLTCDLAEVTATFNKMYESIMEIISESVEKK